VDGADECYSPWNTFSVSAEYLLWWTKGSFTPPLVTTGPVPNLVGPGQFQPGAGVLGQPGTVILAGNEHILDDLRSGFRVSSGIWFDPDRCFGLDGSFFFLGRTTDGFFSGADALGNPPRSRPAINMNSNARQGGTNALIPLGEVVQVTSTTQAGRAATGFNNINSRNEFWGWEANLRTGLYCSPNCSLDLQLGYRTLTLEDDLYFAEFIQGLPPGPTGSSLFLDEFHTRNRFHGGQIGLVGEHRLCERWTIGWNAKVALGNTSQNVGIFGARSVNGGALTQGGFLAQQSNIGGYQRDVFTVVPEVQVNLGYQFHSCLRTFVGYNFLYWSNVARVGEHIDRRINPEFLPGGNNLGPAFPAFQFNGTGYWAQGLNFGLELRW
jgi:hypothetical protein